MARIDQIRFVTDQGDNHRTYDRVRLWIGGVPFSADLMPHTERMARRIAAEEGLEIIDARASTVGF